MPSDIHLYLIFLFLRPRFYKFTAVYYWVKRRHSFMWNCVGEYGLVLISHPLKANLHQISHLLHVECNGRPCFVLDLDKANWHYKRSFDLAIFYKGYFRIRRVIFLIHQSDYLVQSLGRQGSKRFSFAQLTKLFEQLKETEFTVLIVGVILRKYLFCEHLLDVVVIEQEHIL